MNVIEEIEKFKSSYRYKYQGGGYFRDSTVPKGKTAPTVHGDDILNQFVSELIAKLKTSDTVSQSDYSGKTPSLNSCLENQ